MRHLIALAFISAVSASDALPSRLSLAANAARRGGCQGITLEAHQSLPLPVLIGNDLRYRMLIYDASGETPADPDLKVHRPHKTVEFNPNGGEAKCLGVHYQMPRGPGWTRGGVVGDMLSPETLKMGREAYEAREAKLYAATEAAAAAFAAGKKPAKAGAAFSALFAAHSEPALKEYYRAMAADFFAWLEGAKKK